MPVSLKTVSGRVSPANQAAWWKPFDLDRFGNKYFIACIVPINGAATTYHNVLIAKEDTAGNVTSSYCVDGPGRLATWLNDVGHNCPSIVVDANGFIHVFTSMHTNEIRYYRSQAPYDITTMQRQFFEWPDSVWQYTYPTVTKDSAGNVYLLVRCGVQNQTILTHRMGALYKWTPAALTDGAEVLVQPASPGKWSRFKLLFWEADRSFYPDDLRIGTDSLVHTIYEVGPQHAGTLRHRGTYARINASTAGLTDIAGAALTTPLATAVTQGAEVYQDLVEGEEYLANSTSSTFNNMAGIQAAKIIWDSDNNAFQGVVYRYRPMRTSGGSTFGGFGIRVATWNGTAWAHDDLFELDSSSVSTSAAVAATVHGGVFRIYFSIEKGGVAWLCVAVGNPGSWEYYNLSRPAGYTLPLRFQIEQYATVDATGTDDVGYLTAPNLNVAWSVTIPEDLTDLTSYATFDGLIGSL